MKFRKLISFIFLISTISCLVISACSRYPYAPETESKVLHSNLQPQAGNNSPSNLGEIAVKVDHPVPEGMRIFEGEVFVASTKPKAGLWKSAGWKIAKHTQSTDGDDMPSDCTLYPHEGVEDQWIGNCSGNIYIPIDGAKHIAIVLTHPDGNTTHIQVSPIPDQQ